jgi:hypothetical protein
VLLWSRLRQVGRGWQSTGFQCVERLDGLKVVDQHHDALSDYSAGARVNPIVTIPIRDQSKSRRYDSRP